MRYWHSRLNRSLFGNSLRRIKLTHGDSTAVIDAEVFGVFQPCDNEPFIHLDKRITTRWAFLNTLAHEMVHQYQHENNLILNHGGRFKAFAKRFAKHGLQL